MRGRLVSLCAVVTLTLVVAGTASAQRRPGIAVGKGVFYPSIEMEVEDDDNLFQNPNDPIDAQILDIGPNLQWRFPLSQSFISIGYHPSWRYYSDNLVPDTVNHVFELDSRLEYRNGGIQQMKVEYEQGVNELTAFTGGEPTFSGDEFTRIQGNFGYEVPITTRQSFDAAAFGGTFEFDDPEQASFFDFADYGIGLGWAYDLQEKLRYRVEGLGSDNSQDRRDFQYIDFNTGNLITIPSLQENTFTLWSIRSGLDGRLGQRINIKLFYGYAEMSFDDSVEQDYDGGVLELDTTIELSSQWSIRARAGRAPRQSSFNVANFFVDTNAALDLVWESSRRLKISFGAAKQKNSYRDPIVTDIDGDPNTGVDGMGNEIPPNPSNNFVAGVLRRDTIDSVRAQAEFTVRPDRLVVVLNVLDDSRDSNVGFFSFDRTVVRLGVRFGWLPPSSGGI